MEVGIVGAVDPHRTMRRVGRTPPLFPALMHPTLLPRPFHHDGWVYEEKIDGYRMVAVKANGAVQLISRQGCDHTKRFRELVKGLGGLKPKTFVLDGEVAVFDKDLISCFEWLRGCPTMNRPHSRSISSLTFSSSTGLIFGRGPSRNAADC